MHEGWYLAFYEMGTPNNIEISLTQNDPLNNPYGFSEYNINIGIENNTNDFSKDFYIYDSENNESSNNMLSSAISQNYKDWSTAKHRYEGKSTQLSIQEINDSIYFISGKIEFSNNKKMQFIYTGTVPRIRPEVLYVSHYSPSDYKDSKGQMTIGNKKINTPYVYQYTNNDSVKLYIMDRILVMDRNLQYAVSFQLPLDLGINTGTYIYDKSNMNYIPAFFNQNKTDYPDEAILKISYKKREIYQIDYTLKFENGQDIKGTYTGKIPDRYNNR
jgi:hypothetical protein